MGYDSCDRVNREKHVYLKFLALLQAATVITMIVFFMPIHKQYANLCKQPQQSCVSKTSMDKFLQLEKNYIIAFSCNIISLILLLAFLASYPHLSYRYALIMTCFILFAGGVLCMSFSAEGYSVINNDLRNEPPECQQLFKDLKNLFLTGLVIGVPQILIAGYCGWGAYSQLEKTR